ncbi:MAG: NAD(P)/FAD-dependent oxidoreductase [Ornithinimicrobium sp.]|uniref:NAD(P)/FAD-dependent oxidoreductase n=1 Tax=Ornithinimicrobium sp. TaxID=1977084 RepID=UPI003D9AC81E
MPTTPATKPRVIIVGSGFGGLFAAQALDGTDVDITLIGRTTHHLFQPLLYQVATGILSPGEIAPSTREVLARQHNVEVILGDVTHIDVEHRTVLANTLEVEHRYAYDYLIVAAGAGQSYFGHDEFAQHAPGMKSIDDALELRGRIYGAFELAEVAGAQGDQEDLERLTTFVVVGAGPTGVEMAGQLVDLSARTLKGDFRHIDPTAARVILLDAGDAVLTSFDPHLQRKTKEQLEELGVDVRLGAMVVDVNAQGLEYLDGDKQRHRIEAVTKVWAAGVSASPLGADLAEQVGLEVDRTGRVPVQADLTLPGHPEIFVVGDMIALDDLPGVAQVAIQTSRFAAEQIEREIEGKTREPAFDYFDKGNMATISRFRGIAEIGPVKVTGFPAWFMWLVVHLFYLVGFKSRVSTLLHWTITFLGRDRAERVITEQQVFARLAMQESGEQILDRAAGEVAPRSGASPEQTQG